MDNITHSLVGALIGQAGLKRKTGLAMPALIVGANLPDVDAACLFWLDGVEHLGFRRGITHGPIAWVLLPLMLAGALWGYDRWQAKRGTRPAARLPVHFGWLYALAFIATLTHPALDWLNVYGVRLLEPFSSQWFYGDTLFIVDVWLWALMGFACVLSLRREKRGGDYEEPAKWALVIGVLYVLVNTVISWLAATMASGQPAIASPLPLTPWQREVIEPYRDGKWLIDGQAVGDCALEPAIAASQRNPQAEAFLFWSRAPFAERAENGSVILRDARFYDPLVRDRFSVALPQVKCAAIAGE